MKESTKKLCAMCSKNVPPTGYKVCEPCRARAKQNRIARISRLRQSGLCISCGANPCLPNITFCAICSEKQTIRRRLHVQYLMSVGLCIQCGKEQPEEHSRLCRTCMDRRSNRQREQRRECVRLGICIECSTPVASYSKRFCEFHWKKYNLKTHEYRFGGHREEVLKRDSFTCQICLSTEGRMHVHHQDWDENNHSVNNLITVCQRCHNALTDLRLCKDPFKVIEFFKVHFQV